MISRTRERICLGIGHGNKPRCSPCIWAILWDPLPPPPPWDRDTIETNLDIIPGWPLWERERHGLKERSGKWNLTAETKDTGSIEQSGKCGPQERDLKQEVSKERNSAQKVTKDLCHIMPSPSKQVLLVSRKELTKLITRLSFWCAAHR